MNNNIYHDYKEINNNFIIASRAYFLQPPPIGAGTSVATCGLGGTPPYHSQGDTTWSVVHFGEVFGAAASEAYVPHMMDQGHAQEEDHGQFLGPGWGEETPEAELFQEPREGPVDRAGGSNYRVPLIPQEQAYANHGSQEVHVIIAGGCPNPVAPHPSGGGHRGLQERGRDPGSPPRCSEQGVLRR